MSENTRATLPTTTGIWQQNKEEKGDIQAALHPTKREERER